MIKNKVKYIIVTIIIIIIGIMVFVNLFYSKSNKAGNRCGDNAFFEYDKDTHTVTITGIGKVVLPDGIKIIGNFAFYNCDKLCDINFPKNLRIIEQYAFSECATLQEVKLQNIRYIGKNAFEKCYNLKNIEIYGDIPELYSYTFDICLNLRDVKLSNTIKLIANDTFRNCKVLQTDSLFENRETTHQYKWSGSEILKEMQELEKQVLNE